MSYLLIRRFTIHWMILFLPALTVLLSWLRGLLIHTRATAIVNLGMAFNLLATAVLLFVGVHAKLPGIFTAALALNGAHVVELIILCWGVQRSIRQIVERPLEELTLSFARKPTHLDFASFSRNSRLYYQTRPERSLRPPGLNDKEIQNGRHQS